MNRTSTNGPSFCGKTFLLSNELKLLRLDNHAQHLKIITRSLGRYENIQLDEVSVEEDLENRTIQIFQNNGVVFDYMLNIKKIKRPFLPEEDIMI